MDRTALRAFIQRVHPMPEEPLTAILGRFTPRTLAEGEALLTVGVVNDDYVFLSTGWMRSFTYDTRGDEVTTAFHGPGQVVFDMDSFFERTPSRECIVALTPCTGLRLDFAALNDLFHTYPEFREFGRRVLVKHGAALKRRMLSLINETAEQRYDALVRTDPEILQRAPLKHIASYLGVTDTSLSRIRKEWGRK